MIQRIQSVFLALAAICSFGSFGVDALDTTEQIPGDPYFADASFDLIEFIPTSLTIGLAGVIFLLAIFMFRNRKLQLTITKVANFLIGAGVGTILYLIFTSAEILELLRPDFGTVLIISAIIFGAFGARYINKDEKLVRSADRLR